MKKHKKNSSISTIPLVLGYAGAAVGLGFQVAALGKTSAREIDELNTRGQVILLGGLCTALTGLIINRISWKNNAVKAIGIYNSKAMQQDKKEVSFRIIPAYLGMNAVFKKN